MKNSLFLPAALLAGFAWAGKPAPIGPEIQEGKETGDSVFVLDCREPQSDSVYIWKCDSVFVEDSIETARDGLEGPDTLVEDARRVVEGNPTWYPKRKKEAKISGWERFFVGFFEGFSLDLNLDKSDDKAEVKAERKPQELFEPKSDRPSRERGTSRR